MKTSITKSLQDMTKHNPIGVNWMSARNCIAIKYPRTTAYNRNDKHIPERTLLRYAKTKKKIFTIKTNTVVKTSIFIYLKPNTEQITKSDFFDVAKNLYPKKRNVYVILISLKTKKYCIKIIRRNLIH